jgi:hypothetical protein
VSVLDNDTDPERDPLRIDSFTSPPDAMGTVSESRNAAGVPTLDFVPAANFTGTATFSYRVIDPGGEISDAAQVTVEVALADAENQPPVARPDAVLLRVGEPFRLEPLVNDDDPENDSLRLVPPTSLPEGLTARAEGNALVLEAAPGAARLLPFTYGVDDGRGNVAQGSVLAIVAAVDQENRPPLAVTDLPRLVAGNSVIVDVLGNDSDPDGDPLTLVEVRQPSDGSAAITLAGNSAQISAPSTEDVKTITSNLGYTIDDGNGHRVEGVIVLTILPVAPPEPPFAVDDVATTVENTSVVIDVLRNDGDPSGERPVLVGQPSCAGGGSATVTAAGRVSFTPPSGATGVFRCSYRVANSRNLEASATITITVEQAPVTNQPPRPADDALTVLVGETGTANVLLNDTDPDSPASSLDLVSISTSLSLGTASIAGDSIVYRAPESGIGVTLIDYLVSDDQGATARGTLVVTVQEPQRLPPIAVADRRSIEQGGSIVVDVLSNDIDPDGSAGSLRVTDASLVSGAGSVAIVSGGVALTPAGDFSGDLVGTYTITDSDGLTASTSVTLSVLAPANSAPVARPDSFSVPNGREISGNVLFNDDDPDGDSLTATLDSRPDSSLGEFSWGGGAFTFSGTPGASGVTSFTYTISDGEASASTTVTLQVLACADSAPTARSALITTGYQKPVAINLNDYSSGGDIINVQGVISAPIATYTPPAGENGVVSVTWSVRNSCRVTVAGRLDIDVNRAPVANATYSATVAGGASLTIPVGELASDDEPLTVSGVTGAPAWVTVTATGVTVSPGGDIKGRFDFRVNVVDPGGLGALVPVAITVANRAPVAAPDTFAYNGRGTFVLDLLANDSDPEGNPISLQAVPDSVTFDSGTTAALTVTDGVVEVEVNRSTHGRARFSYTIVDSLSNVSEPASVSLLVNRRPRADDREITVEAGTVGVVGISPDDPDDDPLSIAVVDDPLDLVTSISLSEVVVTIPAALAPGGYTVTYRVTDSYGATADGQITVTVKPNSTTTTTTTTTVPVTDPPTTPSPTTSPPTTSPPTTSPPTTPPPTTPPPTT